MGSEGSYERAAESIIWKLAVALRNATQELNEIRARDGVPWTRAGHASSVDEVYFSSVVDNGMEALGEAGVPYTPWAFTETLRPAIAANLKAKGLPS